VEVLQYLYIIISTFSIERTYKSRVMALKTFLLR